MSRIDESLPDELEEVCTGFHQRLQEAKLKLEPFTGRSREELHEAVGDDLVDRAMLDLTVAYATNSLFWCYLCTQGVATADHPIKREMERIKKHMARAKDVQLQKRGRTTTLDRDASKRVVRAGTWEPDAQRKDADSRLKAQNLAQDRAMSKRASSPGRSGLSGGPPEKRRKK